MKKRIISNGWANGTNNANYSGYCNCRIGIRTYTWDSYVSSTYGKRGLEYIKVYNGSTGDRLLST